VVVVVVTGYSSLHPASPLRELTCLWNHTHTVLGLPTTRQRRHSRIYPSQIKLALDLATPEGCQAEFLPSWLVTYGYGTPRAVCIYCY